MRAIKINFSSHDDLDQAVAAGLKLDNAHMQVRLERFYWKPNVWHCRNCWKLVTLQRHAKAKQLVFTVDKTVLDTSPV